MRKLLVFLVVLIALLVGLDIGGRALAESRAGEAIERQTRATAPAVTIHGFSFLVQAVAGHYSNITLTSSAVTAGPIDGINVTMQLYDVDFPLADALRGDTGQLTAAQARLTGAIADSQVSAALGQAGAVISAGPNGAIKVSGTASVAGRVVPVTAALVASFTAGVLRLDATDLEAAGLGVPNLAQLTKGLSLALPLTGLPFTVEAATLTASGSQLILTAIADNVRLAPA